LYFAAFYQRVWVLLADILQMLLFVWIIPTGLLIGAIATVVLLIGSIAGWRAGLTIPGYGFGLIGNFAVGNFGAVISVWYLSRFPLLPMAFFQLEYYGVYIICAFIGALAGWLAGVTMKGLDRSIGIGNIGGVIAMGTIAAMFSDYLIAGYLNAYLDYLGESGFPDFFVMGSRIWTPKVPELITIVSGAIAAWLAGLILMHGADRRIIVGIVGAAITYTLMPLLVYVPPGYAIVFFSAVVAGGWFLLLVGGLAQLFKRMLLRASALRE
jgi:uncharacterized membrane protein YeaQ/YmgE (transglycosylase-associated protein family)